MENGKRKVLKSFIAFDPIDHQATFFRFVTGNMSGMALEIVVTGKPIRNRLRSLHAIVQSPEHIGFQPCPDQFLRHRQRGFTLNQKIRSILAPGDLLVWFGLVSRRAKSLW